MGIDAKYQAMSDNCVLLEKAQAKGRDWIDTLAFYKRYADEEYLARLKMYQARGRPKVDNDTIEFAEDAIRTEKLFPGLKERHLFWGRAWDMVHYLLVAERRGETPQPNDQLITRGILGGDVLDNPPPEERYLFYAVKYIPPDEVQQIVEVFTQITEDQMRQHYDPDAMRGVYKFFPEYYKTDVERDGAYRGIFAAFEELRDFYSLVSEHNEGIITTLF